MAKSQRTAAKAAESEAPTTKAMFVIETRQRDRLQESARDLRGRKGGVGRVDASEILRALLDEWIDAGAKLPKRLLE